MGLTLQAKSAKCDERLLLMIPQVGIKKILFFEKNFDNNF